MNKPDSFGRSPLHVAAAVNYEAMTEFLLASNANIDARTNGELQAPIHYAAKNGAARSLKMLLSFKANIDTLDAKQRTPLQVSFVVLTKKSARRTSHYKDSLEGTRGEDRAKRVNIHVYIKNAMCVSFVYGSAMKGRQ